MRTTVRRLAVLGLGLMGGSLALAARRRGLAAHVSGYARRAATRAQALAAGAVDAAFDDPADAVRGADLVVLCTPVLTMEGLLRACRDALAPGALVTDVGSTKRVLVDTLDMLLRERDAAFVGSHPMCGSEQSGFDVADEGLYEGAMVIVTPAAGTAEDAVGRVSRFWEGVGGRVRVMSPDAHDRTIARTSHLPHLVAAALAVTVGRDGAGAGPYCGSGFRDTSRVAEGSEDMWHDIVKSNDRAILDELGAYERVLVQVRELVAAGDFEGVRRFLASARAHRRALCTRVAGQTKESGE